VSVEFLAHEVELSDEGLMDIVSQRLQNELFEMTKGIAMHHRQRFYVSFPVDLSLPMNDWAALATKYTETIGGYHCWVCFY
jgi:hypothetical protein